MFANPAGTRMWWRATWQWNSFRSWNPRSELELGLGLTITNSSCTRATSGGSTWRKPSARSSRTSQGSTGGMPAGTAIWDRVPPRPWKSLDIFKLFGHPSALVRHNLRIPKCLRNFVQKIIFVKIYLQNIFINIIRHPLLRNITYSKRHMKSWRKKMPTFQKQMKR